MKAQKDSEILEQLNIFTIKGSLELGSLVRFSEVAEKLKNNTIVPEETWKTVKEWKNFITELFMDCGLSVVESDRLFESGKTFAEAFGNIRDKAVEESQEEQKKKLKTLIENMPDGLELDVSDIPSINVSMLKDTKFLLFRKDKFEEIEDELRKLIYDG